ncbi:origin recognition complex subunit 6 Ecym_8200 [Eremothecium cymbalariae DBVPG|uniref:ORC6 first cyclin-like domain-containing protein n=1 Tax=Eremothecium cymbalariae (strain CBS 270.75 / DBVPG 7215 / KCTC 17166 / NRRL Y-17582) TaxID=931890 RepID=G8JXB1_ERECY|nr:Hypothetical protein Ecym_8200 [Eremothecium cymbalariae DBVPG\
MSANQVRQCVVEILGLNERDEQLCWNEGILKKMTSTTTTLYNVSLKKVMLKQPEEIARYHICAYLAAEKLSEKYDPGLAYYNEKIPLEPKKLVKVLGIFKQSLWQSSPVKNLSWSVSPKKDRMGTKSQRFTSMDPKELQDQLFGTPIKPRTERQPLSRTVDLSPSKPRSPNKNNTRRKLAFEEDDEEALSPLSPTKTPRRSIFRNDVEPDPEESDFESPVKSPFKSPSKSASSSPRKKRGEYNQWNMLCKKYYRITPEGIVGLCNQFEIPSKVTFLILDCFGLHATYLVYPAQLVCGLIMLCCFTIYNRKRANNPSIDDFLLQKMCALMRSNDTNDVLEAIKITKELMDGEKWYRDLKIEYDYYDGADFKNSIAVRLGNMLQSTNVIASDEQFAEWKKKVLMDISLRDGPSKPELSNH